jgi:hypothetical protein
MPMDNKQEAENLIKFLLSQKEIAKSSSFIVKHDDLKGHIALDSEGNYDERRIAGVLRAPLRSAGISASAVPGGYRFSVPTERKQVSPVAPAKDTPISMEENGEKAVTTMTDFHTRYVAPKVFNDVKVLVSHGHQVLIVGPPGCGKSRLFEELAVLANCHCIRRQMSQVFDPEQLVGGLQVVKDENSDPPINITKFVPGSLTQAVQNGWFFIGDEYDNASAECNESLKMITEKGGRMVIETEHGVEIVKKHPNFRMGFTANTWGRGDSSGDFPNAHKQNSAALDRITAFIEMGYDEDVEKAIMASMGMENHVIELFYGKPGATDPAKAGLIPSLRTAIEKEEVQGEIGMRKIIDFCNIYPLLGWHKAMLYAMLNKFDKGDHGFFTKVISSKLTSRMIPTSDPSKIKDAEDDLKKYKLKGMT